MTKTATPLLPDVDVELILEGSYPYVTGGVSSWVHRLISGLPEFRFGIVHLAAKREEKREIKYTLPENVCYLQNLYLHDPVFIPSRGEANTLIDSGFFAELFAFHATSRTGCLEGFSSLIRRLSAIENLPALRDLFFSRQAFSFLVALYQKTAPESSFMDFFWTWRFMHLPLVQLLQARPTTARVCHPVSTGYAGFLACLRKLNQQTPVLLTEHGIYTRERTIEITHADWIFDEGHPKHLVRIQQGTFKRLWLDFFHALGLWTYRVSDRIITLFDGNKVAQTALGASPEKIEIIPNGISLEQFLDLRPEHPPHPETFRVGFIGRVVSIKDVKTFLKAAKMVLLRFPKAVFQIIGPLDEEAEYVDEMRRFCAELDISGAVHFLGPQKVREWYPKLDVIVLTSISEGQPLSLLEAMAAGLPCVSTDVGACHELLMGRDREDKALGPCGVITSLRSPGQTAQAIIDICRHPERFLAMVRTGKIRVRTYYQEKQILGRYKRLYENLLRAHPVSTPPKPAAHSVKEMKS